MIHIERQWTENWLTAQGRSLHERVHQADDESRDDIRIVRGLRIHSFRLGLVGQTDVVEFHQSEDGITLSGLEGYWIPFPVEYKRGKPKLDNSDKVQLCAQTIALEEMLKTTIEQGAFFYGKPRRRKQIFFTESLREKTQQTAQNVHKLIKSGKTPKAKYQKKCRSCSMYYQCMPKTTGIEKKVNAYLTNAFEIPEEITNQ